MDTALKSGPMGRSMKGTGLIIKGMAKEKKANLMEIIIMGNLRMGSNQEKVSFIGKMDKIMKGIGCKENIMDKEH